MLRDAKFVKEHDQGPSGKAAQALPEAEEESENQPRQESGSDHTCGAAGCPSDISHPQLIPASSPYPLRCQIAINMKTFPETMTWFDPFSAMMLRLCIKIGTGCGPM